MFRRLTTPQWVFDAALALGTAVVSLAGLTFAVALESTWWLFALSAIAGTAAVLLRRASPPLALAVSAVAAVLQMCAILTPNPQNVAQMVVVYACAAYGSRVVRWVSLAVVPVAAGVATAYLALVFVPMTNALFAEPEFQLQRMSPAELTVAFAITTLTLGCAWLLGWARFLSLRSAESKVLQRVAEVEQSHLQERMAVEQERGRIAREMHDVLAHSLVVIATLSDGARFAIRTDPDAAEQTVRTIGGVSRDALTDVRRLLADLRHEQDSGPAAAFDELPELLAQFRGLGLRIHVDHTGTTAPLTPGASLAAYRVVQESLTNALRHGDADRPVDLHITWTPQALFLRVVNRIRPANAPTGPGLGRGGHGLIGLRERVQLEAGTFTALRAGDEFRVDAALPVGQAETLPDHHRIGARDDVRTVS